MKRLIAALIAGVLVMAIVASWITDYLTVDRCLDHGGRWNAEARICEGLRK